MLGPSWKQPDQLSLRPGQPVQAVAMTKQLRQCRGTQPGRASAEGQAETWRATPAGPGRGAAIQLTHGARTPEGVHLRTLCCCLQGTGGGGAVGHLPSPLVPPDGQWIMWWPWTQFPPSPGSGGPFLPGRQEAALHALRQALGEGIFAL